MTRFSSMRTEAKRRRGMAPLELVMSIPFVLAVMALLFSIAAGSTMKAVGEIEARDLVWKLRANSEVTGDGTIIREDLEKTKELRFTEVVRNKTSSGKWYGEIHRDLRVFLLGKRTTIAKVELLARTWDHEDVKNFKKDAPHFYVLTDMGGVAVGAIAALSMFSDFSFNSLPNQDDILKADKIGNDRQQEANREQDKAKQAAEEHRQKLRDEIEQLETDIKGLREQLKPLQEEYDRSRDNSRRLELERKMAPIKQKIVDKKGQIKEREDTLRLMGDVEN